MRVLTFPDLPYDPACERFYAKGRRVRTASAQQVRATINARGLGRWRRYKSERAADRRVGDGGADCRRDLI